MRAASLVLAIGSLCACTACTENETVAEEPSNEAGTAETRLMDDIEAAVTLPEDASELSKYSRNYAYADGNVVALYTTLDHPGRQWVVDRDKLPVIFDGGCSVIEIEYSLGTRTFSRVDCNGDA